MLGGALVRETGASTVKRRASYGEGIRPARSATRDLAWKGVYQNLPQNELQAEEQSGVETGIRPVAGQSTIFANYALGSARVV
jgi:hypothetical protein